MKLATAEQMRKLDNAAINDYAIPGVVLMENAGAGAVRVMAEHFGPLTGSRVSILVGPGNNGGDGLVMARHLYQMGGLPVVFLLAEPDSIKGEAGINLRIIDELPIPLYICATIDDLIDLLPEILACDFIIDAIFGIGLKREVTGRFAKAMQIINQADCPVIAVDLPSGLDTDTGATYGISVRADLTVTFGLPKPAHVLEISSEACGDLSVIDISIPPEAIDEADLHLELLTRVQVASFLPPRPQNAHKGRFGHLLILAGSNGKTGAAILCGQGALRAGTGLVTLGRPNCIGPIHQIIPEAMTLPLPNSADFLASADLAIILEFAGNMQALALGPGIGTAKETGELVRKLYAKAKVPMVIDADGLNLLAGTKISKKPPAPRILTPHPGEMARLTGRTSTEIQADRIGIARDFATNNNVYLVLKGARTIIAAPDGRVAINPTGNPAMAAGGMGDVLTGLIAGLLAQGLPPWRAACLGVYVHGLAGDLLVEDESCPGILASELAHTIPGAFAKLND